MSASPSTKLLAPASSIGSRASNHKARWNTGNTRKKAHEGTFVVRRHRLKVASFGERLAESVVLEKRGQR